MVMGGCDGRWCAGLGDVDLQGCFLVCGLGSTGWLGEERVEAEAGVVGVPVVVRGGAVGGLGMLDELCRLGRFGGSEVGVGVSTALLRLD